MDIKKGCDDIKYIDIAAYQRVACFKLTAWELSMVLDIDLIRRSER